MSAMEPAAVRVWQFTAVDLGNKWPLAAQLQLDLLVLCTDLLHIFYKLGKYSIQKTFDSSLLK